MLPFACGARSLRSLRSTLKFSAKVARRSLIARTQVSQVKSARSICVTDVADGQWLNRRIQEVVNKNETRMFASTTCQYSLSVACSSILLLTSEDSSNLVSVEASGDDDEVTSSAGKKRKHWKKCADAG